MKKILVVGAGLSGATVARELAEAGKQVLIIDSRSHIAGNAYDFSDKTGIRIHKYGPHLFHTNNEKVFDWLSRFTEWVEYRHKVKAQLEDGRYVTLPVNKETKDVVGEQNVLDIFFRPYTKKMWGMELDELSPSIINRVPIRDDMNEYYFPDDEFQYLPLNGYTYMVRNILDHPLIEIKLNTLYKKEEDHLFEHVFNSMPIDEYFDFKYGHLPYRSIKFTHKFLPISSLLPTATVNFTHDGPHTRVTEWKKLPSHGSNKYSTILTFEEPCDYRENNMERYYPVKDKEGKNRQLYEKYKAEQPDHMTFIGRCGMYVYLDMDQAVNSALAIARKYKESL
jgi:UDP-galactopyranose mutase